jgi:AcrR family transcriptional regulator
MAADDTEAPADLGARLRAVRQRRGVSLRALAGRLGVSPATLSHLERGRTRLSVDRLEQIAGALDTSAHAVLDPAGRGEPAARRADTERSRAPRRIRRQATPVSDPEDGGWRDYPPRAFDPVLDAALAEFLEIGYHGASVRGIAQRCGLSVSGLYHHYESKQSMLRRILELTMAELLWRSRAARAEGEEPVSRFCLLVECLALFHTHRRELGFVGASEMRSLEPANRREIARLRTEQQRMVDVEVEAAVRQGRFHSRHPHEASRAVVTMCTALSQWYQVDGPLSPEQIATEYVEFGLGLMRWRGER